MSVGALASHLGRQVLLTPVLLAADPPAEAPVPLLDHYLRSPWIGTPLDEPVNVRVREGSESAASGGAAALAQQVKAAAHELRALLAGVPSDRVIAIPWAGWAMTLDDYLSTRLLEIVVHCDDLAASPGLTVDPPKLPDQALDATLVTLVRIAARRHGAVPVLRALSRKERAPGSIAAI
jgi:hypothetical protein